MSQRDMQQSGADLRTLVGRPCFVAAEGSSLKVQIDHGEPDAPYIWIDSPWVIAHERLRVEGADCPPYGDPDYDRKFEEWCESFAVLRESYFEGFSAEFDGSVTFQFSGGFEIQVPLDPGFQPEPFSRYDHWYARA